ncbi:hypothetical protein T492DRAFT_1140223 [Pavlovales sp. CCMP2436]|nr:hypothetical protein T492DRAFT_1140223 [Pavlovales sp. CCMP2436]
MRRMGSEGTCVKKEKRKKAYEEEERGGGGGGSLRGGSEVPMCYGVMAGSAGFIGDKQGGFSWVQRGRAERVQRGRADTHLTSTWKGGGTGGEQVEAKYRMKDEYAFEECGPVALKPEVCDRSLWHRRVNQCGGASGTLPKLFQKNGLNTHTGYSLAPSRRPTPRR